MSLGCNECLQSTQRRLIFHYKAILELFSNWLVQANLQERNANVKEIWLVASRWDWQGRGDRWWWYWQPLGRTMQIVNQNLGDSHFGASRRNEMKKEKKYTRKIQTTTRRQSVPHRQQQQQKMKSAVRRRNALAHAVECIADVIRATSVLRNRIQ